jgi:hypothetical protein
VVARRTGVTGETVGVATAAGFAPGSRSLNGFSHPNHMSAATRAISSISRIVTFYWVPSLSEYRKISNLQDADSNRQDLRDDFPGSADETQILNQDCRKIGNEMEGAIQNDYRKKTSGNEDRILRPLAFLSS